MTAFVLSPMINLDLMEVFLICWGVKIRTGSVWSDVSQGILRACVERMAKSRVDLTPKSIFDMRS